MVTKPMRCAAKAAQGAGTPEDAADALASAAAGADVVSQGELIYTSESDRESDSRKHAKSPGSPVAAALEPSKEKALPTKRNEAWYYDMFGSDDELADSSPASARANSQERDDRDGSHHRDSDICGTNASVGTKQEALDRNVLRLASEHKPWQLPERLVNDLSGMTSEHHRIPLFDARMLHGLDISASNFRAEEDFYLDVFLKHRWYSGNYKRDKKSLLRMLSFKTSRTLDVMLGYVNLIRFVLSLSHALQLVRSIDCASCVVRREFLASRGATPARVVLTTRSEPQGMLIPFLPHGEEL